MTFFSFLVFCTCQWVVQVKSQPPCEAECYPWGCALARRGGTGPQSWNGLKKRADFHQCHQVESPGNPGHSPQSAQAQRGVWKHNSKTHFLVSSHEGTREDGQHCAVGCCFYPSNPPSTINSRFLQKHSSARATPTTKLLHCFSFAPAWWR